MESAIADRIIGLAIKWQNKVEWEIAYEQAANSLKFHDDARQEHAAAKQTLKGEMLALFRQSAKQNSKDAKVGQTYAVQANREVLELKSLLREHAPGLLKLMPRFDFFAAMPADLEDKLQRISEIEGAVRERRQPTPSGKHKLKVNCQANEAYLDDQTIPLKQNQAKALSRLIEKRGEYLSLADHGLRSRDIDALPPALKTLVETQPGAGTRILSDKVEMA